MAVSVRSKPAAEKLRGGYYTPAPLGSYLARWAAGAGPRLLEPSCGDGAILAELGADAVGIGIEIDEAAKAALRTPPR